MCLPKIASDWSISALQNEMQSQVEALSLTQLPLRTADTEADQQREPRALQREWRDSSRQHSEANRGVTSDGVGFYTSDYWAKFYPNQEVAVVTSIAQPPIPPEGYVPLRRGHCRAHHTPEAAMVFKKDVLNGFSVDTLLWNEKLLEQRIMQLTAWTRRAPMSRRQQLDRINSMVNRCPLNTLDPKM